jgi:excisionase family DNA binding protein
MPAKPFDVSDVQAALKPRTPALALTVEQACDALSIGYDTWKAHVEPEIRLVRLGRRKLIPVKELERWLDAHAENVLERR